MTAEAEEGKKIVLDSGHWYDGKTGEPRYTTIGKNGKERPTTLRDAKVEGLVPSVTTILQMLPKPFLNKWLQKQVLLSALTLTRGDETDEEYIGRIMADADDQSRKAREKGSAIHGYIERWLLGDALEPEQQIYVDGAIKALAGHLGTDNDFFKKCEPEKSFAIPMGYGGKVDLHSREMNFVCDFKTKEFGPDDIITVYDEHCAQLSAYANGLSMPDNVRLINVFISTTVPGLARVVEHADINMRGWEIFTACLHMWKVIKKF